MHVVGGYHGVGAGPDGDLLQFSVGAAKHEVPVGTAVVPVATVAPRLSLRLGVRSRRVRSLSIWRREAMGHRRARLSHTSSSTVADLQRATGNELRHRLSDRIDRSYVTARTDSSR